ncbi:hypothetical protein [Methanomicrobium mobile]|uniref:hypothetical protein n=1 Tax=Methanomicrobium mobile TaxID=2205 RepID=UPI0005B2ADE1|nr:hypothetical protein [Methanomicrobium mobile]
MEKIEISKAAYNRILSKRRGDETLSAVILREIKCDKKITPLKEKSDTKETFRGSAIMRETAKYGVGTKVIGKSKRTKEDMESVERMERQFMKNTGYVRVK